jgi:ribosomal protein S18 acetylase RimI-like enzyme
MIRYTVADDFYEIMEIEKSSFPHPYTEKEMISMLASNVTKTIESKEKVVGYISYRYTKGGNLLIESLAVNPKFRGQSFGTYAINHVKNIARNKFEVKKIIAYIAEFNIDAQLFFKKNGFKCTRIVKNHYLNSDELSYRFVWRKNEN